MNQFKACQIKLLDVKLLRTQNGFLLLAANGKPEVLLFQLTIDEHQHVSQEALMSLTTTTRSQFTCFGKLDDDHLCLGDSKGNIQLFYST